MMYQRNISCTRQTLQILDPVSRALKSLRFSIRFSGTLRNTSILYLIFQSFVSGQKQRPVNEIYSIQREPHTYFRQQPLHSHTEAAIWWLHSEDREILPMFFCYWKTSFFPLLHAFSYPSSFLSFILPLEKLIPRRAGSESREFLKAGISHFSWGWCGLNYPTFATTC